MENYFYRRVLEIIPGLLTWSAFLITFFLAFYSPIAIAIFILCFDMFWFYRSIRLSINTSIAYNHMKKDAKIDWINKIKSIDYSKNNNIVASKYKFENLYQVILLIFYKEPIELIEESVKSYISSNYNKEKFILVLATEERAGDHGEMVYRYIQNKYGQYFHTILKTVHPADLKGEIKSKSSNATWGAKEIKKYLDKNKINYDQVILHNFDADTKTRPQFFHYVAYKYLTTDINQPTSYQPIHVYLNNMWEAPAAVRVVAMSSTLIFMHNTLREKKLHHFSSRVDIFKTLVDINFWTVDSIPEDSREYYDSFFYYQGKLKIEPLYIPLEMSAVLSDTFFKTIKNQYQQLRRWAWGIVDFPYVVFKAFEDKNISMWKKMYKIFYLLESHFSWATGAIFITILSWIPAYFNPAFSKTVLGANLPFYSRSILIFALMGLIVSIYISLKLIPSKPETTFYYRAHKYTSFVLQWFLVPIVSIFLSAFASIDAQTRLMFGKYLEYQVSDKVAIKN